MMLPSLTDNVQVLCKKTVDDAPSQLLMVGFLSMPHILSTTTTSSIVVVDIYGCSILEVTFSHLWVINKAIMMSSSWISRCLCTACQYKVFYFQMFELEGMQFDFIFYSAASNPPTTFYVSLTQQQPWEITLDCFNKY